MRIRPTREAAIVFARRMYVHMRCRVLIAVERKGAKGRETDAAANTGPAIQEK